MSNETILYAGLITGIFGPAIVLLLTRYLGRNKEHTDITATLQTITDNVAEELRKAYKDNTDLRGENITLRQELSDRDRVDGAGPILELIVRLRAGETPYVESWRLERMPPGTGPLVPKGQKAHD